MGGAYGRSREKSKMADNQADFLLTVNRAAIFESMQAVLDWTLDALAQGVLTLGGWIKVCSWKIKGGF